MLINLPGFNFYYDNNPRKKFRASPTDHWQIEYPATRRSPGNFVSECVAAATEISSYGKPMLMFSGGIDSEAMVRAFIETKQEFDVCIIDYHGANLHDIDYAIKFCDANNIKATRLKINLETFWSTELGQFASLGQTFSPQLCTYMKAASSFSDHVVVIGGGENHLQFREGKWCISEKERISSLHRFFINSNVKGWGGFFQSTPELIRAGLTDPVMQQILNSTSFTDSKDFKGDFYSNTWGIEKRIKYTGFERVQDLDYVHRTALKTNPLFGDQFVYTAINELVDLVV